MHPHGRQKRHSTPKRPVLVCLKQDERRKEFIATMADDLFPLDMHEHDGPVCEEEEEEGVPCEDEQVKKKAKKPKL